MEDRAELSIRANIDFFNLRGDISEHSPELSEIRRALRTGDKAALAGFEARGVIERHRADHNLITTIGRNVLARLLAGDTTYSGQINYGALGTSTAAPSNADTQLGAEVYRKLYASHTTDGNNVVYIDFFYAATDTSGTYQEFGNFIDGTGTANSGRIFSRILTGGWTKTSVQSLFISCQYTIS